MYIVEYLAKMKLIAGVNFHAILPVVTLYFAVIMFMYFIAYQTMERQLEELGNRWIAVCKWIDDQWLHLQVCGIYINY